MSEKNEKIRVRFVLCGAEGRTVKMTVLEMPERYRGVGTIVNTITCWIQSQKRPWLVADCLYLRGSDTGFDDYQADYTYLTSDDAVAQINAFALTISAINGTNFKPKWKTYPCGQCRELIAE